MYIQYGSDVQIRVFDMRMHRMITPLPVVCPSASTTGVSVLRLIPQVDTHPAEFASVLMCTADGIVQVRQCCNVAGMLLWSPPLACVYP